MAGPAVLLRNRAALVVVDVQSKLLAKMEEKEELLKNCKLLTAAAQELSVPIVVTEQYPKGIGQTDGELLETISEPEVIEKDTFSCFGESKFERSLTSKETRHLILCGIESHVCVYQTALHALDFGFSVFVTADAVSSRKEQHKEWALAALNSAGCTVVPTETVVFQLLERCGTKEFKALLPLIK